VLGPARIRIGAMPGGWPAGRVAADHRWRLAALCEAAAVDSLWLSEGLLAPSLHVR